MATILVVDDDVEVVALIKVALGLAGHEVITTPESSKVVPLAAAARVRAVVLDLVLPGWSGYDALAALRADPRTARTPVLILSSLGSGSDRVRGLGEGAADYLTKPFAPLELVLRIERLIRDASSTAPPATTPREPALGGQLAAVATRLDAGQPVSGLVVGRYTVEGVLGEGGMGRVLRAWDPRLQRPLAIKTLSTAAVPAAARCAPTHRDVAASEQVHRLLLEAILVAQINHPNVVAVHDVGEAGDVGFVAMELVEGITLEELLARRPRLALEQAVPLTGAILRGLAAAHRRQVVHHDVKPGNVLLGHDGAIKLTDFGVAQLVTSWLGAEELVYGTAGYLPPETIRGGSYGTAGDVFAAGVILHQCLAGRLPFDGRTTEEVLMRTVRDDAPPLRDSCPDAPPELAELLAGMLDKSPTRRPADAAEVATRLERLAAERGWQWTPLFPPCGEGVENAGSLRSCVLPTLALPHGGARPGLPVDDLHSRAS